MSDISYKTSNKLDKQSSDSGNSNSDFYSNLKLLTAILNALSTTPDDYNSSSSPLSSDQSNQYYNDCLTAAQFLGGLDPAAVQKIITSPPGVSSKNGDDSEINSGESLSTLKSIAYEACETVNQIFLDGKNSQIDITNNPVNEILDLDSTRLGYGQIQTSAVVASQILSDLKICLAFKEPQDNQSQSGPSQVSQFDFSLIGFGGTGDPKQDLQAFSPNFVPELQENLDRLSFKNRVPKILFVADYSNDAGKNGSLVGWKSISDSSGYIITRRNVFTGEEKSWTISTTDTKYVRINFEAYLKKWVTSYFDDIDFSTIEVFLDPQLDGNSWYFYQVQAYQDRIVGKEAIFSVKDIPWMKNSGKLEVVEAKYRAALKGASRNISVWPFISEIIYGDAKYDWILAAMNISAAKERSATDDQISQLSYILADFDTIKLLALKNNIVFVGKDEIAKIMENLNESLQNLGVESTLEELLNDTGIIATIDGTVQPQDSSGLKGIDPQSEETILSKVIAAIDPETLTLDINSLKKNISNSLSKSKNQSESTEISVTDPSSNDSTKTDQGKIDVTNADGMAIVLQTIREMSDGSPSVSVSEPVKTSKKDQNKSSSVGKFSSKFKK